ncbi:MAG: hypothetical protein KC492_16465, partial [Myxococcales bacterium]|nr:hypothetical protein [Myxococcales bacterium]
WVSMIAFVVVGLLLVRRGLRKGNHAKWLRANGEVCSAAVIDAQRTGAEVGDIPLFSLTLEVEGATGKYKASVIALLPPETVALAVGSRVRVLVSPRDPKDVWLDAVESWPTGT